MFKKIVLYVIITIMCFTQLNVVHAENKLLTVDNTKTQTEINVNQITNDKIMDGFEKVAENSELELYVNKSTLGIQIKNKATNYVFSSTHTELEGLNKSWVHFINSGITLEYMNDKQTVSRLPLTDTQVDMNFSKLDNGFKVNLKYNVGFELDLIVELDGKSLTVKVPKESIAETHSVNKLQSIYVFPFLGVTRGDDLPGYLFVPDGSGALIRTNQGTPIATEAYVKRIYGEDLGMGNFITNWNNFTRETEQIYVPVFGLVHQSNNNGIFAIIEDGDTYANIEANISGISTPFNFVTSKFIFRETYRQLTAKSGTTMIVNQKQINEVNIQVKYNFLFKEDANYMGMAKLYQNYLKEKGVLEANQSKDNIPLKLEVLASELKKRLIGFGSEIMTSTKDVDNILQELTNESINNMEVVVRGYNKNGASTTGPTSLSFESKVGTKNDWNNLMNKYPNIPFDFYVEFNKGFETTKGFNNLKDVAQALNKQLMTFYYPGRYTYLTPSYTKNKYTKELINFNKSGINNLAIDTLGSKLYANYTKGQESTREQSKQIYTELLTNKQNLYKPNSYLWDKTKQIFDMPMSSSQYTIFTDTIPFLQIVLKGYIPYYSPASNFNADTQQSILNIIEYGAYPSFYVTKEDPINIIDTASNWLFTSKFSVWKEQMVNEYHTINDALKQVDGAEIINRQVLELGVIKVDYSNGYSIYINYNKKPYVSSNIEIQEESFKVVPLM